MMVIPYFDSDDNKDLARMQHDVYGQALGIIVSVCNQLANRVEAMEPGADHEGWGTVERFDHRTLQIAHDLLASVWRCRNTSSLKDFSSDDALRGLRTELQWLGWLHGEIVGWVDKPWMVRSVQQILTNQNRPVGLMAESELSVEIMSSFPEVPWRSDLRNADEGAACQMLDELESTTAPKATER